MSMIGTRRISFLSDLLDKLLGINLKPKPVPPPAPTPAPFRPQNLVDAMNAERARRGIGPLTMDGRLNRAAQDWAGEMARRGELTHENFMGRIQAAMLAGPAEDIAMGQTSVSQVMQSWMNSPPHRANILAPNYKLCGVGRSVAGGAVYWCADFHEGSPHP
jgi:uncharacterized protein YkwD